MLARVERGQDLLRVKRSRRVDTDDVEIATRDQLVEIRCQSVDPEFAAEHFELVLPRVTQSGDSNRQAAVFRLVGTKQRSAVAKPGDADAELAHFRFSPGLWRNYGQITRPSNWQ